MPELPHPIYQMGQRANGRILRFIDRGQVFWESNVGPQSEIMWMPEFEGMTGGSRGGGKSAGLMAWMVKGNMDLPEDHPCFASVLNSKNYIGVLFRQTADDLKAFLEEADPFYAKFGGVRKDEPAVYEFPNPETGKLKGGPKIFTNHLQDANATNKIKGWNVARAGIEELTLLKDQGTYLRLLASVRTPYKELRPAWSDALGQVLSTTNPDGPGSYWVYKRFVNLFSKAGTQIPWGCTVFDPVSGLTRCFIPSKLKDNPYLGDTYRGVLLMQADNDPALVRAWLDGDWNSLRGPYFSNFRASAPFTGEPDHAFHCVRSGDVPLMPWWPRYIGVDWGFRHEAAAYWVCLNQADGRFYVYREFIAQRMGAKQFGAEIARRTQEDLAGQQDMHIPLFLSHECFNVTDEGPTRAQIIAAGINEVLGAGSVVVSGRGGEEEFRYIGDGESSISLHPAGKDRIAGWQHIYDLLRFEELAPVGVPDPEYARVLLDQPNGFQKYEKYMAGFDRKVNPVLPGLRIFRDKAGRLVEQIEAAVHDERPGKRRDDILEDGGTHSNDRLDALRHVLHSLKKRNEFMPRAGFISERMATMPQEVLDDPTRRAMVYRKASLDYDGKYKRHDEPFNLVRPGGRR